jgi:hypothetical protein
MKTKFPNYDENSYRKEFMKAVEEEINSGKTEAEKEQIRKEFLKTDLLEIQNTGGTSDTKIIRNVIRENYTHNSLLNEIKNKASTSSINKERSHYEDTMNLFD